MNFISLQIFSKTIEKEMTEEKKRDLPEVENEMRYECIWS